MLKSVLAGSGCRGDITAPDLPREIVGLLTQATMLLKLGSDLSSSSSKPSTQTSISESLSPFVPLCCPSVPPSPFLSKSIYLLCWARRFLSIVPHCHESIPMSLSLCTFLSTCSETGEDLCVHNIYTHMYVCMYVCMYVGCMHSGDVLRKI